MLPVAIPSRGLSSHLMRLLKGLSQQAQSVCIYIDSTKTSDTDLLNDAISSQSFKSVVSVFGPSERSQYRDLLSEECGDAKAVDMVLGMSGESSWKVGALRNLVLLQNAGGKAVSIDDDIVPEVRCHPFISNNLKVGSSLDPTDWWPEARREDAWFGAQRQDILTVLGKALEMDTRIPILASCLGFAGDSGVGRSTTWLAAPVEVRARMYRNYPSRYESRAMCRVAPELTLTSSPWFMGGCFAFNAGVLLPPFMPIHRNSDGIWGLSIARCSESGLFAHLPYAVRHDPPDSRKFQKYDLAKHATSFRMSDLIQWTINDAKLSGTNSTDRLNCLADRFEDLASYPPEHLVSYVRRITIHWLEGIHRLLLNALDAEAPEAWREEVDLAISEVRKALTLPPAPMEHPEFSENNHVGVAKDLEILAQTLAIWPKLWKTARALNK